MQQPIHAENRARNYIQKLINNEEVDIPLDIDPLSKKVDH
jgi:hypothetical protein